jgi:hypothetical protein
LNGINRKPTRAGFEREPNAEIAKDEGQEWERKQHPFLYREIWVEFSEYFVGTVYVLPRDEPAVAAAEMPVEHPFGRDFARKRISRTSLAGDDDQHLAAVFT